MLRCGAGQRREVRDGRRLARRTPRDAPVLPTRPRGTAPWRPSSAPPRVSRVRLGAPRDSNRPRSCMRAQQSTSRLTRPLLGARQRSAANGPTPCIACEPSHGSAHPPRLSTGRAIAAAARNLEGDCCAESSVDATSARRRAAATAVGVDDACTAGMPTPLARRGHEVCVERRDAAPAVGLRDGDHLPCEGVVEDVDLQREL